MDHLRVHPKFLHSNATSHKWALGGRRYYDVKIIENFIDIFFLLPYKLIKVVLCMEWKNLLTLCILIAQLLQSF
jgi:hypothetical protein